MELEFEIEQFLDEETKGLGKTCPTCGLTVIGDYCTLCKKHIPAEKYYDPDFEEYFEKLEKEGEEFRKDLDDKSKWVEVEDDKVGSFS